MKKDGLLFPPVFADDDMTCRARLLHSVLWIIIIVVTVQLTVAFIVLPQNFERWITIIAVVNVSHLLFLAANRRGHTKAASYGLLGVLWAVITAAAVTAGGIHAQAVSAYLLLVFAAGLLLGEGVGIATGIICGLTTFGMVLLERYGHLPASFIIHTPISIWVTKALYMGVIIGFQFLATRTVKQALQRARAEIKVRREAETALRESEQRYREVYENSSDFIFLLDACPGGNFCFNGWNSACEQGFGFSSKVVAGKVPEDLFSAEHARQMSRNFRRCANSGMRISFEESFIFDGREIHFFTTLIPLKDDTGHVHRLVGIGHNITERKVAEEKLRESEARYRVVVEQTGQLVYDYDAASGRIVWRGAIARLTGYSENEFQDVDIHQWEKMIHPSDRANAMASFHVAQEKVMAYHAEYRFRCKNGAYVYMEDHGLFLPDATGKAMRMLGVMADITAHKQAEEAMLRSRDNLELRVRERTAELQLVNEELNAFTYSVSHDLRAPLRAIQGFSGILQEDHLRELSSDGQELLKRIEVNVSRMEELITDLLKLSRVGTQALVREVVNVDLLVRETVEELRALEKPGRDIQVCIGELPECEADISLLKQVFVNLISNAFKFTRQRRSASVTVSSEHRQSEMVYFVRDNGVGFDPQKAGRLFGAFQRMHSHEQFEGTGVGLSIVQRIVKRHGGRIWADAAVGQGATFYFTIAPPSAIRKRAQSEPMHSLSA